MKTIEVRINRDGSNVKVTADGFVGSSCEEATAKLIAKLGQTIKSEKKPEFYDMEVNPIAIGQ
mgnify:CR=1 FL=1